MYRSCSIRCRVTSTILLPLAMLGCDTPREVSSSRIQLQRPVAQLEVEALAAMPPVEEGEKLQPKLVDLSQLDPGLRFDIRCAGVARLVVRPVAHRDRSPAHARVRAPSAAVLAARHPTSGTTRETHRASPRTLPATGPTRSGTHAACRAPRRHTMPSAQAVVKRGGWRSAYFSQPILEGDRSLFSPVPSPTVPRQWAQSANSLGKWRARQDSNLRPSA